MSTDSIIINYSFTSSDKEGVKKTEEKSLTITPLETDESMDMKSTVEEIKSAATIDYACRAECMADVLSVIEWLVSIGVEISDIKINCEPLVMQDGSLFPIPDVDCTFSVNVPHEGLTNLLYAAYKMGERDWHVLIESLMPISEYDGKRENPYA